ncbi:MAG: RDD family protein [Conexibacter sp.]
MTRARDALQHQGHYAGPISRLLAYAADTAIIGIVYTAAIALLRFAIDAATPWTLNVEGVVFAVGALLWSALYWGSSWVGFGRSPGMSLLGLRIVRADGSALDRRHALIRLLTYPLGFLTLGAGFLGIIFGRTRQAIYDRIADTAVVYDWDAEAAKLRELATRGGQRRHLASPPSAASERDATAEA